MMKRKRSPEELMLTALSVKTMNHIVADLKLMEKNTKQTVDQLVTTALQMFIATHSDYLGKHK